MEKHRSVKIINNGHLLVKMKTKLHSMSGAYNAKIWTLIKANVKKPRMTQKAMERFLLRVKRINRIWNASNLEQNTSDNKYRFLIKKFKLNFIEHRIRYRPNRIVKEWTSY